MQAMFSSNFKRFGSTWRLWLLNTPTLVTADPRLLKLILGGNKHLEKHFLYEYSTKIIFGNGLVTSDVDQWKQDRKSWNQVFSVEYFASGFKLCVESWHKLERVIFANENKPFDCQHHFRLFFIFITLKSFIDDPTFTTDKEICKLEKLMINGLDLANIRTMKPWTRNPIYWKIFGYKRKLENIHKHFGTYLSKLINSNMREGQTLDRESQGSYEKTNENTGTRSRMTVKDLLCDVNKSWAWKYDHAVTNLAAAADTSVVALTMVLFFLALNPECQKKAQDEVDCFYAGNEDESLRFREITKMKYLRMCIKEAMRLHPPVPQVGRITSEDIFLDGYKIPKGAAVLIILRELNMNPEFFPNPHKFDPERFSDSNLSSIKPYTYVPFSAGPRNCIGQKYAESTLPPVLAQILRTFNVTTEQTADDIKLLYEIAGTPYPNVEVIFNRR